VASFALGPYTVSAGTTVALQPPSSGPWGWAVISNLSPYLLQVTSGVLQGWLEPWTENIYDASSVQTSIQLVASLPAGVPIIGSSQVEVTWFDPATKPAGVWPSSLTADAISALAQAPVDFLGVFLNGGLAALGTPATIVNVGKAQHSYQTVAVMLGTIAAVAPPAGFCVSVLNNTSIVQSAYQYQPIRPGPRNAGPLFFPVPCNVGDVLQVAIVQTWGTPAGGLFPVTVLGLGGEVQPAPLRSDGRSMPQRSLVVGGTNTGPYAGAALIAAPAAGCRILLSGCNLAGGPPQSYFLVLGTLNGAANTFAALVTPAAQSANLDKQWEEGLLLDAATAVTQSVTAASPVALAVDYDIVV
jgi:hypothetical protein